ncbi:MAG: hypothetical protein V1809_14910 [Planctomycetota bacterium]|jgi:hypothetical protein
MGIDQEGFTILIAVLASLAVMMLLVLFIILEIKMNRIMKRLDDIAGSASTFVKLGMKYFKGKGEE